MLFPIDIQLPLVTFYSETQKGPKIFRFNFNTQIDLKDVIILYINKYFSSFIKSEMFYNIPLFAISNAQNL